MLQSKHAFSLSLQFILSGFSTFYLNILPPSLLITRLIKMTSNIPNIHILLNDTAYADTFNEACSTYWPSFVSHSHLRFSVQTINISGKLKFPHGYKFNLVVAPADSYGRLDRLKGYDHEMADAIVQGLVPSGKYDDLHALIQRTLYRKCRGFTPPGSCVLVRLPKDMQQQNDYNCNLLAVCPTMRTHADVNWDEEVIYEAVWSLLCQVEDINRRVAASGFDERGIETILMTALGAGNGGISKERWAAQTVMAIRHFVDAVEYPGRWSMLDWRDINMIISPDIRSTICEVPEGSQDDRDGQDEDSTSDEVTEDDGHYSTIDTTDEDIMETD